MPRPTKRSKSVILVFCEGESEQVYTDFLKKEFGDVAAIRRPASTGLFDEADNKFKKDKKYREDPFRVVNFLIEEDGIMRCPNGKKFYLQYRKNVKGNKYGHQEKVYQWIKVRLLMTTGCIEYWLMLHYDMYAPSIQTVAEKQRVMDRLLAKEPNYRKGDAAVTAKIAQNYPTAVINARQTVSNLLQQGLPSLEDTDDRNRWLCQKCLTFSTVYEAIDFLTSLQ